MYSNTQPIAAISSQNLSNMVALCAAPLQPFREFLQPSPPKRLLRSPPTCTASVQAVTCTVQAEELYYCSHAPFRVESRVQLLEQESTNKTHLFGSAPPALLAVVKGIPTCRRLQGLRTALVQLTRNRIYLVLILLLLPSPPFATPTSPL